MMPHVFSAYQDEPANAEDDWEGDAKFRFALTRARIVDAVMVAQKSLLSHFAGGMQFVYDQQASSLCSALEDILNHGLSVNVDSFYTLVCAVVNSGTTSMRELHESTIFVNTLARVNTSLGRLRAWLRVCLNEGTLAECLRLLMQCESVFSHFQEGSVVRSEDAREMVLMGLVGLTNVDFQLTVDDARFDQFNFGEKTSLKSKGGKRKTKKGKRQSRLSKQVVIMDAEREHGPTSALGGISFEQQSPSVVRRAFPATPHPAGTNGARRGKDRALPSPGAPVHDFPAVVAASKEDDHTPPVEVPDLLDSPATDLSAGGTPPLSSPDHSTPPDSPAPASTVPAPIHDSSDPQDVPNAPTATSSSETAAGHAANERPAAEVTGARVSLAATPSVPLAVSPSALTAPTVLEEMGKDQAFADVDAYLARCTAVPAEGGVEDKMTTSAAPAGGGGGGSTDATEPQEAVGANGEVSSAEDGEDDSNGDDDDDEGGEDADGDDEDEDDSWEKIPDPRVSFLDPEPTARPLLYDQPTTRDMIASAAAVMRADATINCALILTAPPPLHALEEHDRCEACTAQLVVGESRMCRYSGKFFCRNAQCFGSLKSIIPRRVVMMWDFKQYPVCREAFNEIEINKEQPIFDLGLIKPDVFTSVKKLGDVKELREQLARIKMYILSCRDAEELRLLLWPRDHFLTGEVDVYSLDDLLTLKKGGSRKAIKKLKGVVKTLVRHVLQCEVCSGKGFICEVCRSPTPIYPFQRGSTIQCEKCMACFHDACFDEDTECPKCARQQSMKVKAQESQMCLSAQLLLCEEDNALSFIRLSMRGPVTDEQETLMFMEPGGAVTVGVHPLLNMDNQSPFTFACVVRTEESYSESTVSLLSKHPVEDPDPTDPGYRLVIHNGLPSFRLSNGRSSASVQGTSRVDDHAWHYLAVVRGKRLILYVDGVNEGEISEDLGPAVNGHTLSIGSSAFVGSIRSVNVARREWSPQEIRNNFREEQYELIDVS